MSGSSYGKTFNLITFGESHGKAVGVVIDGLKAGIEISETYIQNELNKRRPNQSKLTTSRDEKDKIEIVSGVFQGKTTGASICILVYNKSFDSSKYENFKDIFRPGHADFTFYEKYGLRDYRGGGRSSGRETISRVIAGSIFKRELEKKGIKITASTIQIGKVRADNYVESEIYNNPVRTADKDAAKEMENAVLQAKENNDSIGGVVKIIISGLKAGVGEPVFDKLDAELSKAFFSIGAVKGVEIGSGFEAAELLGSQNNDEMFAKNGDIKFKTNNSGGILGGISNGNDVICKVAIKPTPSIFQKQKSINKDLENIEFEIRGKHDPCIVPRAIPVIENMAAIVIYDLLNLQNLRNESNSIDTYREKIDVIDKEILILLKNRFDIAKNIGNIKKEMSINVLDENRETKIYNQLEILSDELGLDKEFTKTIYKNIITHSKKLQKEKK